MHYLVSWLSAPNGPGTPFGNPALVLLDSIRCLIIGVGGLILILTPIAIGRTLLTIGQAVRITSLAMFMAVAMLTEIDHFGDYAHWRLFVNIVATIGAAWGMWSLFVWEIPAVLKGTRTHD